MASGRGAAVGTGAAGVGMNAPNTEFNSCCTCTSTPLAEGAEEAEAEAEDAEVLVSAEGAGVESIEEEVKSLARRVVPFSCKCRRSTWLGCFFAKLAASRNSKSPVILKGE